MNDNLIYTLYLAVAFGGLFIFAEILYHVFKIKADITRKIVHVCTGLFTLTFPALLTNHLYVMLLCASFLIILILSMRFSLLPSINGVSRATLGSLFYPIIVYACYLFFIRFGSLSFFYIPILILAISDPIAELVGKNFPWRKYTVLGHSKTLSGSIGFYFSALILSTIFLHYFESFSVIHSFLLSIFLAFFTMIAEGVSHKGYDNLSIPGISLAVLIIYNQYHFFV